MIARHVWLFGIGGVVLLGSSCQGPAEPPDRILGMAYISERPGVEPSIVLNANGDSLKVSVRTYGDGCYSRGQLVVHQQGAHVLLTPYEANRPIVPTYCSNLTTAPTYGCRLLVHGL